MLSGIAKTKELALLFQYIWWELYKKNWFKLKKKNHTINIEVNIYYIIYIYCILSDQKSSALKQRSGNEIK